MKFRYFVILLLASLTFLFRDGFKRDTVFASNDGPVGQMAAVYNQVPEGVTGVWDDLHWVGLRMPDAPLDFSTALRCVCSPVLWGKVQYPASLFLLGLAAYYCVRRMGLGFGACAFAGLAAALSGHYFSTACWGVGETVVGVAFAFLALGLLAQVDHPTVVLLAGACVGLSVAEAYDVGAILSLLVAAYAFYKACQEYDWTSGVIRVCVVAAVAACVSAHTLSGLVGSQLEGAAERSPQDKWDFATQWSYPPSELPGVFISGLFGYRCDSPGGYAYWGKVGRPRQLDEAYERWVNGGRFGEGPQAPAQAWRFTGGGEYAGVLAVLLAFGAGRRQWFWWTVLGAALLLSFGRYTPFYQLAYALPGLGQVRNPAKYLHVFHLVLVVLAAHGADRLFHGEVRPKVTHLVALCAALAVAGFGWSGAKETVLRAITETGFDRGTGLMLFARSCWAFADCAQMVALASILTIPISFHKQWCSRAPWWAALVLVIDLGRHDRHWVVTQDWRETTASNPVVEFLRAHKGEGRCALFPGTQGPLAEYWNGWLQHALPYHNVPSLDVVQLSRPGADLVKFQEATEKRLLVRYVVTSTRWLVGYGSTNVPLPKALDLGALAIYEVTNAYPYAKLFPRGAVSGGKLEALDPQWPLVDEKVLKWPEDAPYDKTATNGFTLQVREPKLWVATGYAAEPSFLLLSLHYDKYWKVTVDGQKTQALRTDGVLTGVPLGTGRHEVRAEYLPPRKGFYVSAVSLLVVLGAWCYRGRRL